MEIALTLAQILVTHELTVHLSAYVPVEAFPVMNLNDVDWKLIRQIEPYTLFWISAFRPFES